MCRARDDGLCQYTGELHGSRLTSRNLAACVSPHSRVVRWRARLHISQPRWPGGGTVQPRTEPVTLLLRLDLAIHIICLLHKDLVPFINLFILHFRGHLISQLFMKLVLFQSEPRIQILITGIQSKKVVHNLCRCLVGPVLFTP